MEKMDIVAQEDLMRWDALIERVKFGGGNTGLNIQAVLLPNGLEIT